MMIPVALIQDIALELAQYRDDEDLFLDTLDGETDILDIVDALIEEVQQSAALANSIKDREAILKQRRERIESRAAAARDGLLKVLAAADLKKVERPSATVSRRAGSMSVAIVDETEIPTQLLVEKITYSPDKKAIKAALDAGENIPGAILRRGNETIMLKV
jgi:hypothetical protein